MAQVSDIVTPGLIDFESVITPGIFVDGLVHVPYPQQEEILMRAGKEYA